MSDKLDIAIGKSLQPQSVFLGSSDLGSGRNRVVIGIGALAQGDFAVAIGPYALARGRGALALGNGAHAEGDGAIAIGDDVVAYGPGEVKVGTLGKFDRESLRMLSSKTLPDGLINALIHTFYDMEKQSE